MAEDNWQHPSEGMRCQTCIWWVCEDLRVLGRCRRHAPTMQGFVPTFNTDWCGDHRLDENKVIQAVPKFERGNRQGKDEHA